MPVVAASRCGLNVDDRPKADLESGLGASPRGFESRILRSSVTRHDATKSVVSISAEAPWCPGTTARPSIEGQ